MGVLRKKPQPITQAIPQRWVIGDRTATGLILFVLTFVLTFTGALSRIDNLIYDIAQKLTNRAIPQDVVIVAIDEESLSRIGRWPWSRRTHAQLIDHLRDSGAKVIGFDILLSEPQREDPQADILLANALRQAGNVVLPMVIEKVSLRGQLVENQPIPLLTAAAAAIGRVHAELDTDSIARSITLWEGIGEPAWPHFTQAMLATAGQLPPAMQRHAPAVQNESPTALAQYGQRFINFTTAQHHIPTISYALVIQGQYLPNTFRNKLVLVGATAAGLADSIPTPISGLREPTAGVEFLANALISMRAQTLITQAPPWLTLLVGCTLAVLPVLWMPYSSALTGLALNIGFLLTSLLVCMALPIFEQAWLPMTASMTGIFSAYPIWALLKLQSASRFLDKELDRLHQELKKWHQLDTPQPDPDAIQNRILQVQTATTKLLELEQQQRETMAFVSHDIRVPIASAAAQAKHELGEQHPIYRQLTKALTWTENFLHTSRAQALDPASFETLDLIDLIHQVSDEVYPLTQERQQQLDTQLPHATIWIKGHFDSLSRALTNLMSNALKFSPPKSSIRITVNLAAQEAIIAISDQGPGIAPEDLTRIFQRFSQIKANHHNTQHGVGLGLYYVQIVADKHKATIKVASQPGQTTISIHIPITDN